MKRDKLNKNNVSFNGIDWMLVYKRSRIEQDKKYRNKIMLLIFALTIGGFLTGILLEKHELFDTFHSKSVQAYNYRMGIK